MDQGYLTTLRPTKNATDSLLHSLLDALYKADNYLGSRKKEKCIYSRQETTEFLILKYIGISHSVK